MGQPAGLRPPPRGPGGGGEEARTRALLPPGRSPAFSRGVGPPLFRFAGGDSGFPARFSAAKTRVPAFPSFQKRKAPPPAGPFIFVSMRSCVSAESGCAALWQMVKCSATGAHRMGFTFETEYSAKTMAFMARALRKTIRKKHSRRKAESFRSGSSALQNL